MAIALLFASCSFGQPQPQVPQSKEGNKAGEKTRTETPEVPARHEQTTRTPDKETPAETGQKVDNDRRIANYTEVLAIVGVLQFFALIIQAYFLYKAFSESQGASVLAEKALLLTERADLLMEGVDISTEPYFGGASIIVLVFKNYGRTRANRVNTNFSLVVPDSTETASPSHSVATVVGAGDTLRLPFHPIGEFFTNETLIEIIAGRVEMTFSGAITYVDVFDKAHTTRCSGVFRSSDRSFLVTENQGD